MKKLLIVLIGCIMTAQSISSITYAANTYRPKTSQTYILGPKGGCYYVNKNKKKIYVDRKLCQKK